MRVAILSAVCELDWLVSNDRLANTVLFISSAWPNWQCSRTTGCCFDSFIIFSFFRMQLSLFRNDIYIYLARTCSACHLICPTLSHSGLYSSAVLVFPFLFHPGFSTRVLNTSFWSEVFEHSKFLREFNSKFNRSLWLAFGLSINFFYKVSSSKIRDILV